MARGGSDRMPIFEHVIQIVTADRYPISGDELARFSVEVKHYLSRSGILGDVFVQETGRPESLLEIQAIVMDRANTLQEVSGALRQAWLAVAYSDFEAATCLWYANGTILRFVTAMDRERGGVYVTGEAIASGGPYERLVERFEHDFGDVHGGLGLMPPREP
jgi:hypothetical protein